VKTKSLGFMDVIHGTDQDARAAAEARCATMVLRGAVQGLIEQFWKNQMVVRLAARKSAREIIQPWTAPSAGHQQFKPPELPPRRFWALERTVARDVVS
jgi:hypothetical protein